MDARWKVMKPKIKREKKYKPSAPQRESEPINETLAMLWNARKKPPKK
jgi:hypothetical protein